MEVKTFMDERSVNQSIGFFDPWKKYKLSTFSSLIKKVKIKASRKDVQVSSQSAIFGKRLFIQPCHDPSTKHRDWSKNCILLSSKTVFLTLCSLRESFYENKKIKFDTLFGKRYNGYWKLTSTICISTLRKIPYFHLIF